MRFTKTASESEREREPLATSRKWVIGIGAGASAILIAACGSAGSSGYTGVQPVQPPAASQSSAAPAASPVSTTASLTSNCVMGYENMQSQTETYGDGQSYEEASGQYGDFSQTAGVTISTTAPSGDVNSTSYAPAMAYQITLTNTGSTTANVVSIAVAFSDSSGTEQGSQDNPATGYILPGQSLTWTVVSPHATDGTSIDPATQAASSDIPLSTASCSLVQWDHP